MECARFALCASDRSGGGGGRGETGKRLRSWKDKDGNVTRGGRREREMETEGNLTADSRG